MTAAEIANRTAKAARLAQQLLVHHASLEQVEALGDAGWSMVAELAGDKYPSELTRAAVIGLFREMGEPDPFAGFGDTGLALDRAKTQARGGR